MTKEKGSPESFCRSLEWGIPISWTSSGVGIHQLDASRLIKLFPETSGWAYTYTGFKVEVVNKWSGRIDGNFILFDPHLEPAPGTRKTDDGFRVISNCGWEWYIMQPKETRPFCKAVEDYIDQWR